MSRGRPRKNKESSLINEHDDSFHASKTDVKQFRKAVVIHDFSFPVKSSPFHASVMSSFSRGAIIKNESLARDMKKADKPVDIIEG